jgi:hypothetical protein
MGLLNLADKNRGKGYHDSLQGRICTFNRYRVIRRTKQGEREILLGGRVGEDSFNSPILRVLTRGGEKEKKKEKTPAIRGVRAVCPLL